MWLIIQVNIFGISMALLALLGLVSPPVVVIPFVFTSTLIDPLYRFLRDPRYRKTALITLVTG